MSLYESRAQQELDEAHSQAALYANKWLTYALGITSGCLTQLVFLICWYPTVRRVMATILNSFFPELIVGMFWFGVFLYHCWAKHRSTGDCSKLDRIFHRTNLGFACLLGMVVAVHATWGNWTPSYVATGLRLVSPKAAIVVEEKLPEVVEMPVVLPVEPPVVPESYTLDIPDWGPTELSSNDLACIAMSQSDVNRLIVVSALATKYGSKKQVGAFVNVCHPLTRESFIFLVRKSKELSLPLPDLDWRAVLAASIGYRFKGEGAEVIEALPDYEDAKYVLAEYEKIAPLWMAVTSD